MALVIPGNLVVKNGSTVHSTEMRWEQKEIYKEGADVVLDGGKLDVDGEILVGGQVIIEDENSTVYVEKLHY